MLDLSTSGDNAARVINTDVWVSGISGYFFWGLEELMLNFPVLLRVRKTTARRMTYLSSRRGQSWSPSPCVRLEWDCQTRATGISCFCDHNWRPWRKTEGVSYAKCCNKCLFTWMEWMDGKIDSGENVTLVIVFILHRAWLGNYNKWLKPSHFNPHKV